MFEFIPNLLAFYRMYSSLSKYVVFDSVKNIDSHIGKVDSKWRQIVITFVHFHIDGLFFEIMQEYRPSDISISLQTIRVVNLETRRAEYLDTIRI